MVFEYAAATVWMSAALPLAPAALVAGALVVGAEVSVVKPAVVLAELPVAAADPPGPQAAVARPVAASTAPAAIPVTRRILPPGRSGPCRITTGTREEFPAVTDDPQRCDGGH
jgi:hypothetical protein